MTATKTKLQSIRDSILQTQTDKNMPDTKTLLEQKSTLQENLVGLKAQARSGTLKQPHLIKATKRDLARVTQALEYQANTQQFLDFLKAYEDACACEGATCSTISEQ